MPYININILTPLIIVLYIVALFATRKSSENIEDEEQGATNKFEEKSVKTLAWSFVAYSVVLVGVSVWAALTQNVKITNTITISASGQTKVEVVVSEYIHAGKTGITAAPTDSTEPLRPSATPLPDPTVPRKATLPTIPSIPGPKPATIAHAYNL